jgi:surface carbohydrate biosynthesis protein
LKFNFTSIEYYKEFVKFVSIRFILTAFNYHASFYRLSKDTSVKTLMLQKGARTNSSKIIKKSELFFSKNSKNIFYVDYVLLFDSSVCRFYSV